MKICFLSIEYPPDTDWGGISTYTYNVSKYLSLLGHKVHVITWDVDNRGKIIIDGNLTIHRIAIKKAWQQLLLKIIKIKILRAINNYFPVNALIYNYEVYMKAITLNPDIIQVCEIRAEAFFLVFSKKQKVITHLVTNTYLYKKFNKQKLVISDFLTAKMEQFQTRRSTNIFTPSKIMAKRVSQEWRIPLDRIHVIPTPIDLNRMNNYKKKCFCFDKYLLYFGRLEEKKGVPIIANALPEVLRTFSDIKMVFVGKDKGFKDYIRQINHQYENRIIFMEHLEKEKLYPIVYNAYLVLLPSLFDPFPNACLEAMSLGKVVVGTKNTGFEEIIEDKVSGFLVEPGDVDSLKKCIIGILRGEYDLERISRNAENEVRKYDIDTIAEILLDLYEETIKK